MPVSTRDGPANATNAIPSPPSRIRQTLVGGAPSSRLVLAEALTHAPDLIAADGGADACLAAGLVPDLVVGDLDSVSEAARAAFADRLRHVPEQDSTDFAKALAAREAALTLAVGFTGARADHLLACLTELARSRARCILLDATDCILLCPPRIALDLAPGTRVSLWPLGPARGRSTGLRWPVDGIALSPTGRVGTSNAAEGPVAVEMDGPCLLILPSACLGPLVAALDAAPRPPGPATL